MACGDDADANLDAAARARRARRRRDGAQIVCTQELFRSQYFCQSEDHRFFALAETDPRAVHRRASRSSRRSTASSSSRRSSRSAPPGCTTTPRRSSTPTARCWASTARCTSRTTRCSTRSSTSRRATPGFRAWKTRYAHDRRAHLLGPVVSRGGAAHGAAGRRDPLLPDRHRLASDGEGGVRRARSTTSWEIDPAQPRRRQRLLRVRRRTASGTSACRRRRQARERGRHRVLGPVVRRRARRAGRRRAPARTAKRCCVVRLRPRAGRVQRARTGRSCATAASTPTATSPSASPTARHLRPAERVRRTPHADAPASCRHAGRARLLLPARSGRRTPARGSAGRGPRASRFPAATTAPSTTSRGVVARDRARTSRCTSTCRTRTTSASCASARARAGVPLRRVRFHHIPTNECWTRDHGPAFVLRTRRGRVEAAVVDWGFNAWGGKYPPWDADDAVPTRVAAALGLPVFHAGHRDGGRRRRRQRRGHACSRPTSCLLNKNRNPGLSQRRDRAVPAGLLRPAARASGSATASTATTPTATSTTWRASSTRARSSRRSRTTRATPTTAVLRDNRRRLDRARDAGRPAVRRSSSCRCRAPVVHEGQRLPATYVNFYFVNGALLVPTFGDRARDRAGARASCSARCPARRVVGVDCRALIWGLGAIHCLTQQQPRELTASWPQPALAAGRARPSALLARRRRARSSTATPSACWATAPRTTRPGSRPSPPPSAIIHFESYIIHDDATGARVRRRARRARQGRACACGSSYDWVGARRRDAARVLVSASTTPASRCAPSTRRGLAARSRGWRATIARCWRSTAASPSCRGCAWATRGWAAPGGASRGATPASRSAARPWPTSHAEFADMWAATGAAAARRTSGRTATPIAAAGTRGAARRRQPAGRRRHAAARHPGRAGWRASACGSPTPTSWACRPTCRR